MLSGKALKTLVDTCTVGGLLLAANRDGLCRAR